MYATGAETGAPTNHTLISPIPNPKFNEIKKLTVKKGMKLTQQSQRPRILLPRLPHPNKCARPSFNIKLAHGSRNEGFSQRVRDLHHHDVAEGVGGLALAVDFPETVHYVGGAAEVGEVAFGPVDYVFRAFEVES